MTDALLARLTAPADETTRAKFVQPPWPAGMAPTPQRLNRDPSGPVPAADVVVITYTSAERQAMADVLTPGLSVGDWCNYAENFNSYKPDFTWRSPAQEVGRLGEYALITVGDTRVLCFHSQCHLATDSAALPLVRLFATLIEETGCTAWIDTGTSGGIGPDVVEGDTVVAQNLVFDCTGFLKAMPFAHESYPCTLDTSGIDFTQAESLMAVNAGLLKPEASRDPKVWKADVITCDSFLFDMVGDPFQLETYDKGAALSEEMDASCIFLTEPLLGKTPMPKVTSCRSVSDPRMPAGTVKEEKAAAAVVYQRFGYAAQAATLCAVWQVITDL